MAVLETEVQECLNHSEAAFEQGRSAFFDQFAKDAIVFTADSTEPIKGREAYQQRYEAALAANRREKTILERNIQVVGDKAVVTQKARITEADKTATVSQTMVYGNTNEGLKVLHAQTSLLTPQKSNSGSTVRVVNERIAAVADTVGVAQ